MLISHALKISIRRFIKISKFVENNLQTNNFYENLNFNIRFINEPLNRNDMKAKFLLYGARLIR